MLETLWFLALGSFETSSEFADVRTHLRKVSMMTLSSI